MKTECLKYLAFRAKKTFCSNRNPPYWPCPIHSYQLHAATEYLTIADGKLIFNVL